MECLNIAVIWLRTSTEHHYGDSPRLELEHNENHTYLIVAQEAQDIYWAALLALEKALGVEVDGAHDLREASVEYLLEQGDVNPISSPSS